MNAHDADLLSRNRKPSAGGKISAPATTRAQSAIRDCTTSDLASVARLFQKTFRRGRNTNLTTLTAQLRETFFDHPWRDADLTSKVIANDRGDITGFIGILPVRMTFEGRQIRAAHAGSLMVDNPRKDPLAGARLLRALLSGPQDFSFSETSNAVSRGMWERLGGVVVPDLSMDWLRVFKPASSLVELAREWTPFVRVFKPAALVTDRLLKFDARSPFSVDAISAKVVDVNGDDDALAAAITEQSQRFRVAPQWDAATLRWILARASDPKRYGDFICRLVHGRGSSPLGCFLYHARPGGIAVVLQVLHAAGQAGHVFDALLNDAADLGCVAIRGRTSRELLPHLQRRHCVFVSRASLTFRTRDAALGAAVMSGDALVTGLAGESWSQLIGGEFTR